MRRKKEKYFRKKTHFQKAVLLSEMFFIAFVLGYLYFSLQPRLVSPSSGLVIDDFDFNFEVEHAETLMLSKSASFKDSFFIEKGEEVVLAPGTYYWKAISFLGESEMRNFTITTSLVLSLRDQGEVYAVVNQGNVDASVVHGEETQILEPKTSSEFQKSDDVFEGRQA